MPKTTYEVDGVVQEAEVLTGKTPEVNWNKKKERKEIQKRKKESKKRSKQKDHGTTYANSPATAIVTLAAMLINDFIVKRK